MRKSQRRRITAIMRYVLLTGWAVIAFFPIFWMISTSFKPDTQWFAWPPFYFPHPPTLGLPHQPAAFCPEYMASSDCFSRRSSRIANRTMTIISSMTR